jgi:CRP-like cAMP-binding protein
MDNIRKYFEKFIDLEDHIWKLFTERLQPKIVPKNGVILAKGQIENHVSIIETGIIRFVIPNVESDTTFGFGFNGHFFSAYDSFISKIPSEYQIEALVETKIWRISHQDLNALFDQTSEGNSIGRQIAEQFFVGKQKRELSLLTQSAEERYFNLFTHQPQLIKEIPLKYIASYIGITPQALSRIRARTT